MIYIKRLKGRTTNGVDQPEKYILQWISKNARVFANDVVKALNSGFAFESSTPRKYIIGESRTAKSNSIWTSIRQKWCAKVDQTLQHLPNTEENTMKKNAMKDAFSDISNQSEATTTLAVAVIREWIARWWECYTNGWEPYVGDFIIGDLTWLDDKINQNMADATDEAVEDWIEEKIEDVIQDIDPNAIQIVIPNNILNPNQDIDPEDQVGEIVDSLIEHGSLRNPCEAAHDFKFTAGNRWKNRLVSSRNQTFSPFISINI